MEPDNLGEDDVLEGSLVGDTGDLACAIGMEGGNGLFGKNEDSDVVDGTLKGSEAIDNADANACGTVDASGSQAATGKSVKASSPQLPPANTFNGKEISSVFNEACSKNRLSKTSSINRTASDEKVIYELPKIQILTPDTDKDDVEPVGTSEAKVSDVSKSLMKPNMSFSELQKSSVSSLLPGFLARMEAANNELKTEAASGSIATHCMELQESGDEAEVGQYIEMSLGLGVLQENDGMTSSSGDETSSDDSAVGVMQKLMGRKRRCNMGKRRSGSKKPKIDEL